MDAIGLTWLVTMGDRPEKDHAKQLHALSHLFKSHPEYSQSGKKAVKMVLMGGVRDEGDENRVEGLRALAKNLNIDVSSRSGKMEIAS